MIQIQKLSKRTSGRHLVVLAGKLSDLPEGLLSAEEIRYIKHQKTAKKNLIGIQRLKFWIYIYFIDTKKERNLLLEQCRVKGDVLGRRVNSALGESLEILAGGEMKDEVLAFTEGLLLGQYRFIKYKTKAEEDEKSLKEIFLVCPSIQKTDLQTLEIITESVYRCRDLINEPVNNLNAEALAGVFSRLGKASGINVEVLNKARIEALKMGGLLGVNLGSPDPPTFTLMEYKPRGAVNKKPYVLVGKGVTYDTGGISLKPSASMTEMKSDMSGAAAVGLTIYAVASAKLPVWLIALIPATDNRPSGNAQVPGDVIRMYDGTTVEVLNTDAEGRLILADALAYAKKYQPALVIDLATLTGAASAAIGKYGMVGMQVKSKKEFDLLQECGNEVHERIVEFPMWDDYADLIKSEVADIKNIGGAHAGAITAGKFLEHFTDYPYIHLDIAGPAFSDKRDSWRGQGGTGVGIRLLFQFFKKLSAKK